MMKKLTWLLVLALTVFAFCAAAEEAPVHVKVTICADGSDVPALVLGEVSAADTDGDGVIGIADALYCAHESFFEGGAEAGFSCEVGDYGLMLTRLWGVGDGVSFGYYRNTAAAMNLADPVEDGDIVSAFVYRDTAGFSDQFCWFDTYELTAKSGDEVTLTLTAAGWDENWSPVELPLAGAELVLDGVPSGIMTDENGIAGFVLPEGVGLITARKADAVLVPPVCRIAE